MLGTYPRTERFKAERRERERLEARFDKAEGVISGVESRLSSLAYAAPELELVKLRELAEVSRRLVAEYRRGAVSESDTAELDVAA